MVELEEYRIERGSGGERLTQTHNLEMFDETVEFILPTWGEKAEFNNDFGPETPKADRVDTKKILRYFKKTFKDPNFSRTTEDQLDGTNGDFIQKLLDILGYLYTHPDQRESMDLDIDLDTEADQKKSKGEKSEP